MKYSLFITWMDGDYRPVDETEEFDDFSAAIEKFNMNCALITGSAILIENTTKTIIRQFVKKGDQIILK